MIEQTTPAGAPPAASGAPLFRSVLVANRGEIACRILRTLRRLGIEGVAVYSDADRDAPHVREADRAIRIGPAAASASYLDVDAVVGAAVRAGADAVHPGYGFLSENPALASACAAAGIVFIGPSVEAITLMGDKIRAKEHVVARGVPVIEGVADPSLDDVALAAAAERIGFPLIVKPAGGGGGKGMQVVRAAGDLPAALASAHRVAASAFGDPTLLLERLVEHPRHIEVQVLADVHGAVVHLGERECSLQRRHQKVIEESPSPLVDEALRRRLGEAACAVAASVGYRGVGTVEFLVSADRPEEFAFLEMNTRLQVEHPVTELVTGLDLVEWQVRVAAGEPLGFAQEDVVLHGHAFEARLYAEDPAADFLPQTGTVLELAFPAGPGVRVDGGIARGSVVGSDYDPMLAKIVTWGRDRAEALERLDRALADTVLLGVRTNLRFLRELLADEDVVTGRLDTGLIARLLETEPTTSVDRLAVVAAALFDQAGAGDVGPGPVWSAPSGWRLGAPRPVERRYRAGAETVTVLVDGGGTGTSVAIDSDDSPRFGPARLDRRDTTGPPWTLEVDGESRPCWIAVRGNDVWVAVDGRIHVLERRTRATEVADALAAADPATSMNGPEVRSPMPGTVTAVHVVDGASVTVGTVLVTVEAMKMEHHLKAAVDGIATVHVAAGGLVRQGQSVATIAPASTTDGNTSSATPSATNVAANASANVTTSDGTAEASGSAHDAAPSTTTPAPPMGASA
ncbi:acetyl/propionyl/methylcrotonyl-CoA carboxylase subunit alpha [Plantibacter sp. YIM 135249]|uniref:acetyl/propionyl/methylcrotonyl-CoA carboxylase subunit alpha n=1 Tax=Plantibacter sp. YIM 135249 TaxID=3423918 RepID=UPI003D357D8F